MPPRLRAVFYVLTLKRPKLRGLIPLSQWEKRLVTSSGAFRVTKKVDLFSTNTADRLRHFLRSQANRLASQNLYIGTSSWKYPGWCGQFYDASLYSPRGRFSEAAFKKLCLAEYASVFKSVCVDAGYYAFPSERSLEQMCAQVPSDFKFAFKVTDLITLKHFPKLPRFGQQAGKTNEHFLNADLFSASFLGPCESFKQQIGVLIFEFSQFHERDFARGRDFVSSLDIFLGQLPPDWQYSVEVRNRNLLRPEYFEVLNRHGVAHTFNSWTRMPPVIEQMEIPGSKTTDFRVARFLLTPGRSYQQAVDNFSPYRKIQAADEEARTAGTTLIKEAKKASRRPSFVFVNNRLEGNALRTLEAMLAF